MASTAVQFRRPRAAAREAARSRGHLRRAVTALLGRILPDLGPVPRPGAGPFFSASYTVNEARRTSLLLFGRDVVAARIGQERVIGDRDDRRKIAVRNPFRPGELGDVVGDR